MNQREKILAAALLVILVLVGGSVLLKRHRAAATLRAGQLETARDKLQKDTMTVEAGRMAMRQLSKWQELSLPPNRDVARSLYHGWLLQRAKSAGLKVEDINPNQQTTPSMAFQSIGFVIEARGTLSAVTKFLYEFYRAAQLQQITKLQLNATPGSPELRIQLRIEAMILPGATHEDSLPDGKSDRLKLASASEYEKSIVGRDIFKAYTPPSPPREIVRTTPRLPPEFDKLTQTYVTGILGPPANLQAWIYVRTTGDVFRVRAGDDFEVGELKGKVESVSPFMVVIKTEDDKQLRVKLGQNIREAEKDAADSEKAAAKPSPETEDS